MDEDPPSLCYPSQLLHACTQSEKKKREIETPIGGASCSRGVECARKPGAVTIALCVDARWMEQANGCNASIWHKRQSRDARLLPPQTNHGRPASLGQYFPSHWTRLAGWVIIDACVCNGHYTVSTAVCQTIILNLCVMYSVLDGIRMLQIIIIIIVVIIIMMCIYIRLRTTRCKAETRVK